MTQNKKIEVISAVSDIMFWVSVISMIYGLLANKPNEWFFGTMIPCSISLILSLLKIMKNKQKT